MAEENKELDLKVLSHEYAAEIVQALALAQRNKQVNGPADLQILIAAGIEVALEDFKEKLNPKTKIITG